MNRIANYLTGISLIVKKKKRYNKEAHGRHRIFHEHSDFEEVS